MAKNDQVEPGEVNDSRLIEWNTHLAKRLERVIQIAEDGKQLPIEYNNYEELLDQIIDAARGEEQ